MAGLADERKDQVLTGNIVQAGNRMPTARQAAMAAGLPVPVPELTLIRICGPVAQAVVSVIFEIMAGGAEIAIAAGVEHRDRAAYLLHGRRWRYRMGPAQIMDNMPDDGLSDAFSGDYLSWHIEDRATREQISHEDQDGFAARSQTACNAAP